MLLCGDTHVGVDHPLRPRVDRRRRGDDFVANFARALAPAHAGDVDVVVHAGDVFDHPRVPPALVERALGMLRQVAATGVPVLVVPGNHERSRVDVPLHCRHPALQVFTEPRTVVLERAGLRLAFAGFPYVRRDVRGSFRSLLAQTDLARTPADVRILCMHHCVEGATCGPGNFTFRDSHDVVRADDLPESAAVVLTGHIHRHQMLRDRRGGEPLPTPVLYAGSVERTSFAEKDETKGYAIVQLEPGGGGRGRLAGWSFHPLPARPMVLCDLGVEGVSRSTLENRIAAAIRGAPADAILRIRLFGEPSAASLPAVRAATLRALAPATMNVSVTVCTPTHGRSH